MQVSNDKWTLDMFEKENFWQVGLLFLLSIIPFSLGYLVVAPSEMFYTDAAIQMLQTGDFLTPYFDEKLRFHKPILTYWWVVVSYLTLGVSYWTSRLPFLLGGVFLLWITYKSSLLVMPKDRKTALLAALLLGIHPLTVLGASRVMPDMPLTVYTTLGLWGALGMLKYEGKKMGYVYLFYLGFALSVAAKGVPG